MKVEFILTMKSTCFFKNHHFCVESVFVKKLKRLLIRSVILFAWPVESVAPWKEAPKKLNVTCSQDFLQFATTRYIVIN